MIRKIIRIDAEKCNGCGACVAACHEGAVALKNGKAVLVRDDYCDGLGDCLPLCPVGAICFEERKALPYDEQAVQKNRQEQAKRAMSCGCFEGRSRDLLSLPNNECGNLGAEKAILHPLGLRQWPVQLRLVPSDADFLACADLLLAADCAAYACVSFHQQFMPGRVTLIACPKLDGIDYAEKLTSILAQNNIRSILVTKMSVPCCLETAKAAMRAIQKSGKKIPLKVVTLSLEGLILESSSGGKQHSRKSP